MQLKLCNWFAVLIDNQIEGRLSIFLSQSAFCSCESRFESVPLESGRAKPPLFPVAESNARQPHNAVLLLRIKFAAFLVSYSVLRHSFWNTGFALADLGD